MVSSHVDPWGPGWVTSANHDDRNPVRHNRIAYGIVWRFQPFIHT